MTRSDTPYADLYEASQEVSAMALAAAFWALDLLRSARGCLDPAQRTADAVAILRSAMRIRRERRTARARILAESFLREIAHGS